MDQTTEQTAQPDVTQTTTTLTAEQPTTETAAATLTTPEVPAVDFKTLIPEEIEPLAFYLLGLRPTLVERLILLL